MQRSVFLSTFLFAAVLSPITLYGNDCAPPADARLATLELRVGSFHGENTIEGFDPNVFSYDARFPEEESVGVLWVRTKHPSQSIEVQYDGMPVKLVGQSVARLDVPLGSSELTIDVATRGPMPDSQRYVVRVERVPVFACTEQGIREAIARGGGPIYFDCDEPTVVPTEAEIVIDNDVILDGEGNLIVDAQGTVPPAPGEIAPKVNGAHRVFSIPEGVTAELLGFTVTGGSTDGDGGGILNAGTFALTSSTVSGNSAERAGGVGNLETGILTVVASTVTSNTANLVGGIGNLGVAEMIDTSVSLNTATTDGGGVGNAGGATMTITDSIVRSNTAGGQAGGIGSEALGILTLTNTTVADNQAETNGGVTSGGELTMNDCVISGNFASLATAGIAIDEEGTATLTRVTVSDNATEGFAGGIWIGGSLTVVDSLVSDNTAVLDGGGIYNLGELSLISTRVAGNSADLGGGVLNVEIGTLTTADSTVSKNTAARFGGGIRNLGLAEVTNTDVSDNTAMIAAGGISNRPGAMMTLTGTTVQGNVAEASAAGIGNAGTLMLNNTTVSNNEAGGDGGGIRNLESGTLALTNSSVTDNTANDSGGGIRNFGYAEVNNSEVARNAARNGFGGGLSSIEPPATLLLNNTTVSDNTAKLGGGGIGNSGFASLTGTTVSGNASRDTGGGIASAGGVITLTNSTVSGNAATSAGGGGIGNAATMTLISSTVSGNTAVFGGTAIWDGGRLTLRNTVVDGDCNIDSPEFVSLGGNIESPGNTCLLIPGIDLLNVPPARLGLGPLADNGGPTQTQALAPFSVALDRIPEPECVDGNGFPLLTDQRGVPRPQGPACDSGAFELSDGPQPVGACVNDVDRAAYESLEYVDDQGVLWTCIDAASAIGNDCVFGSPHSEPPVEGCGAEASAVIACFPNCPEEVIDAFGACVAFCTAEAAGLSSSCADCYGDAAACGAEFCTFACAGDLNSPPCISCRIENGCIPGFDSCSGLPGDIDCGGAGGVEYAQDFESLDRLSATALSGDGWLIFGQVFDADGVFKFNYGAFPAPNGVGVFSDVVTGEGGPNQGAQQMVVYNDYNCCSPDQGHFNGTDRVASSVFRQPFTATNPISATDVGETVEFSFDAKRGNINDPTGSSTALAFIQTLDPAFTQTNFMQIDMTNLPAGTWGRYSISLTIDPSLMGQYLEFGFLNTASNFEPSGVFYDNVLFETGAGGSGGTGGTGGSGGTGGGGGSPGICTDGELRCSADLPQIEICFNDFWEPYEECPPESVCQEEPDVSCVAPSVIVGDGIWDANGHQYVVVEFRAQTWNTSNADLSNQLPGFHLATITSQEEQDFVNNLVAGLASGELWLGGFQDPITELNPAAGWTWVTGEPWAYTNWLSSEPNDTIGVEQHLALDRGGWNDEGSAIGAVGGYLAESFDPVAP